MKYHWSKIKSRASTLQKYYKSYQHIPTSGIDHDYIRDLIKSLTELNYTENYKKLRGTVQVETTKIANGMRTQQDINNVVWFVSYLYWYKVGSRYLISAKDFAFTVFDKSRNIHKYIMPTQSTSCFDCGVDMYFRTRNELETYIKYGDINLCPDCLKKKYDEGKIKKLPYKVYLMTSHWKETREAALIAADNKCVVCGNKANLNVHHRNYYCLGEEEPEDLAVLCQDCHKKIHKL